MREFFLFLKNLIDADGSFGNVMLFNEQPDKTRNKQFRATKKRSVYIEFVVDEVLTKTLGINDYDLLVRFTIANDNKKFSKLDDITLLESLNNIIQNQAGFEENVFAFSSMIRTFFELDTDHDQISEPFNEYKTTLRDFSGYKYRDLTEGTLGNFDITVTIVETV